MDPQKFNYLIVDILGLISDKPLEQKDIIIGYKNRFGVGVELEDVKAALLALKADNKIEINNSKYIKKTTDDDWYQWDILTVAQKLHMSHTGTGDTMGFAEFFEARNWLKKRVDGWRKNAEFTKQYDDAVLDLCRAVLEETRDDWGRYKPE